MLREGRGWRGGAVRCFLFLSIRIRFNFFLLSFFFKSILYVLGVIGFRYIWFNFVLFDGVGVGRDFWLCGARGGLRFFVIGKEE